MVLAMINLIIWAQMMENNIHSYRSLCVLYKYRKTKNPVAGRGSML